MLMLLDFRVRQRDFLLEISRAITAQLELSEVLRRVLNASVVMLGGQVGLVTLRDPQGGYRVRATMGVDTARVQTINEQLQQIFTGESLDYDTLSARLTEIAEALDKRLKQPFALPLIFAGEPLGLLIVFRSYVATATPDDMQVLESFADQAAIAVHNAQLYERIDHERRRLAAILQHSADGVMILDAQAQILSINHALERMTGWSAADAVGRDQDEVITWKKLESGDLKKALDDGWPFKNASDAPDSLYVEGDLMRRDGLTVSLGIVYSPLLTAEGRLSNIVANVRDITNFLEYAGEPAALKRQAIGVWVILFLVLLTCAFALSMFFHEILNRNPLTALMFGFLTMTVLCLLIVAALALFGKSQISQVKAPQATIAETKASIGAITDAIEFGAQDAKNRTTPSDAVAVTTAAKLVKPASDDWA